MKLTSFLIAAVFGAATVGAWAYANRPASEPAWPSRVRGFAFSPYQVDQDPGRGDFPTFAQVEADLALLSGKTDAVRTYSTAGTLEAVPQLAARHDINVAIGAWINANPANNAAEMTRATRLARVHANVVRVLIGNEVVLRKDVPVAQLIAFLDRARAQIDQPVGTAEPWHVWLAHPELAAHVDFLAIHILPYWEGVDVDRAVEYTVERFREVQRAFPGKPIVIGEVGWPSNGRTRDAAVASASNEALFLRRFLQRADQEKYLYYLMEAFDQPWKGQQEGAVGAYWGVYDGARQPKFELIEPIVRIPHWHLLATVSVALAVLLLGLFYLNSALAPRGRSFLAVVAYATATAAVWVIYDYSQQYFTVTSVLVGAVLMIGMMGVIAVLLAEAHEWAEAHWGTARERVLALRTTDRERTPQVSIHVPAYNEPPEMLIETLDALARLDYPDYEVLVIDNNTRDEAVWRPVEAHCRALGPRFRFFHVAPLAGFKAGALNFALARTAADASIVAVIDSDYVVNPNWLHDLVPAFDDERMAIIQAPQDYRDVGDVGDVGDDVRGNAFKAMCYAEYRGFFYIGMITRNERNAIIQHGTMTMVRREVLEEVGGWSEWCITEDAELGMRVFQAGYEASYIPRTYGRGLMPDTFIDFRKQRHRWAYGAMQILKAHARALFSRAGGLSAGQRYHFIAGWLPWVADGFNLIFNLAALGWSLAMVFAPNVFDPPLLMFSVLPLSLFTFKLVKLVHLYRTRVGANLRQTVAAAFAGLALAHTIGVAVVSGLLTRSEPFFRTPKQGQRQALARALSAARQELFMMLALWAAALAVSRIPLMGSPDLTVWQVALVIQSVPYAATVVVSTVSALRLPAQLVGVAGRNREQVAQGHRLQETGRAIGKISIVVRE